MAIGIKAEQVNLKVTKENNNSVQIFRESNLWDYGFIISSPKISM